MKWFDDISIVGQLFLSIAVIVVGSTLSHLIMGFFKLPSRVSKLESEIISFKELFDKMVRPIHEFIMKNKFVVPGSPKQITDIGKTLLEKHKIDDFLKTCPLVQNVSTLKDKEELDIFLKCLEWIDKNGEKKIAEIMYETEISHNQCRELLALAIRDAILHKIK